MRRPVMVLCAAMAVAATTTAPAAADTVACGDVITADVVLDRSLTGCDAGLVIAADGVTVDLRGHVIAGTGAAGSVGIQAAGVSGVTVANGAIRDFDEGVVLSNTTESTVDRVVVGDAALTGISLRDGEGVTVTHSVVTGSGIGILADFGEAQLHANVVARNQSGIVAVFGSGGITRNVVSRNARDGITVVRYAATGGVHRNLATHNGGSGIRSEDSHGAYTANVLIRNGGDGMRIVDFLPDHGRFFSADRNTAVANAGVGLAVPAGTADGGRNRARANGGPQQCLNLACR
jgi:hypothetical protein